jgi:hypothetical protein
MLLAALLLGFANVPVAQAQAAAGPLVLYADAVAPGGGGTSSG